MPLVEENDTRGEELFTMDEIKLEVMRARGAGGQVRAHSILQGSTLTGIDSTSTKPNQQSDSPTSRLVSLSLCKTSAVNIRIDDGLSRCYGRVF